MFKKIIKYLLPKTILDIRSKYISRKIDEQFKDETPEQVFNVIYKEKLWGGDSGGKYSSGSGSHDSNVVDPYVVSVKDFIVSLQKKVDVVDVGCGDFNVGSRLRSVCGQYVACDIVDGLIQRNKKVFGELGVDFRTLNIIDDSLPDGEIIFIRQVFQHLNNEQILKVIPKLSKYKYVVLTEHLPVESHFQANLDKPAGPGVRMAVDSGVVITEAPFALDPIERQVVCCVQDEERGGIVQTMVYRLN